MDKKQLCKDIGTFFGEFFEQDGQLCIDNGEEVFRYDSEDALLAGWVDTLVWHQHDTFGDASGNWEDAIAFIFSEVMGKFPAGVQLVDGVKGRRWRCSVDVADGSVHGRNLHLGTYASIVDAMFARMEFLPLVKEGRCVEELAALAKEKASMEKARQKGLLSAMSPA